MSKKEMIISALEDIEYSLELILERFKDIHTSDDFLKDSVGLERLDSISMRLIAIGEAFKNVDKLSDYNLLIKYNSIPWKDVKGIRDILSHHYFQIDAEIIYEVCSNNLEELLKTVKQIQQDLQ